METTFAATDVDRLAENLENLPAPVAGPVFIVISGLPGTGKSYFTKKLVERLPLAVLESDALRKTLFPSPTYSAVESARLFKAIHQLTEKLLNDGISVVLDATNLMERYRIILYDIAERLNIKLILVSVEAPVRVVRERLKNRPGISEGKSDADWLIYQKLKATAEKIRRRHYVVDTSRDITPVLDRIVREASR